MASQNVEFSEIRPIRLAYVVSHPIQYQAELLRRIAADPEIDLTVFFCSDFSVRAYRDKGFGVAVTWDVPLTEGYRHVFLPRWRDTSTPRPFSPIARGFLRAFHRGIDGHPFDVIWSHGYSTVNSLHAMLAAKALGIPVLLRAEPWLSDRNRSPARLLVKRQFFHLLRHLVTAVLPIGSRNAQYWAHYFGERFPAFMVPYAVNNEFFARGRQKAEPMREDLRKELNLEPGRPVLLFASKLQNRKHCDHLLEAFLQLESNFDKASRPYLVVVGDGEQMPQLQRRAAESGTQSVRFAGFRNQSELPRFFDLAAVFVLPSRHEAWGLIVNEAMASGLPVVVSDDMGCATDLVRNGVNGFVYPVGDIPALRHALEQVLLPGVGERMGCASLQAIDRWSYREDLQNLKKALVFATRRPLRNMGIDTTPQEDWSPTEHNGKETPNAATGAL